MRWCSSTPRKAENSLRDDVALYLRRAAIDRLRLRPHPAILPAAVLDREWRIWPERAVQALHAHRRLLNALVHLAPVELGHAGLRTRRRSLLSLREVAQPDEPEHVGLDLSLRDFLPHCHI